MAEALQSCSLSSTAIIFYFLTFSFSLRREGRKPEISSPEAGEKGVTAVSQHGPLSTLFFPMAGFEVNFVGRRSRRKEKGEFWWLAILLVLKFPTKQKDIFCRGLYSLGMRFCLCTYICVLFWVFPLKMVPLLGRAGDTSLHGAGASEPPLKILPLFFGLKLWFLAQCNFILNLPADLSSSSKCQLFAEKQLSPSFE